MKIKVKEELTLKDAGVLLTAKKGDEIEVTEATGKWEVDAGRATEVKDEPKKKD